MIKHSISNSKISKDISQLLRWISLTAALLLIISIQTLLAQAKNDAELSVQEMSLYDVLQIAEENNYRVRMAESDVEIARSQYRQTNAVFLPQISIEETGVRTNDPLNVFGFKLKQESVSQADFNPNLLNNPEPLENFTTKVQVEQPLFNPDQFYRRSAVKHQLSAAKEQLQGSKEETRYRVKEAYYGLIVSRERTSVVETSLNAARKNKERAGDLLDQGMISKADYLAAVVRVRDLESRLAQTQDQLQTNRENLRFLLGIDEDVVIRPTDSLQMVAVSPGEFSEKSLLENSSLKALQYRIKAAEESVKSSKSGFLPTVNAFGSIEFNDTAPFGTQGNNYFVGATLKWNLFSGFSKAGKVMQSRAELKKAETAYQSQTSRTRMKIKQARRSALQAQHQFELAEASIEQAAEDFRIRTDRYRQGLETTSALLQAESRLAQARLQRLNALYQHYMSLAVLELLIEQDLQN